MNEPILIRVNVLGQRANMCRYRCGDCRWESDPYDKPERAYKAWEKHHRKEHQA